MTIVITRLFDTYDQAKQAVAELERRGSRHADISIVANNAEGQLGVHDPADTGSGAGAGATIGTVLGGGAGLLAGLGMLAIPGVGPVVAAGWLVATAVGAGVGAGAGGLLGSLVGAGVSESDANVYSEGVRRGGTLVTVRADESERADIERVMDQFQGVDAATRGAEYRAGGWERFDESAPAYVAGASPMLGAAAPDTVAPGLTPEAERRGRSTTIV